MKCSGTIQRQLTRTLYINQEILPIYQLSTPDQTAQQQDDLHIKIQNQLNEQSLVRPSIDEQSIPVSITKKPWMAPKLILIPEVSILNNVGGGGDGDAATAHS